MKKNIFILSLFLSFFLVVSCSKKNPEAEAIPSVIADAPLEYVLEDLSGTVMVLTSGDTQAEPAEEEQTVQAGDEIITQAGSEVSLSLNENTMFHLSENSDVKVNQLIRNPTDGFTSQLSLITGKILSEVEKLSDSKSTFDIESGGVVCGVRGTAFEVAKDEGDVQTTTFHGAVEVQKDSNTQTVEADQHSDFSLGQGAFLPKRACTDEEKARYQSWQAKAGELRKKIAERWARLRAIDRLPPIEKQNMLQQLNGAKGKNRLKMLHQAAQERRENSSPGGSQEPQRTNNPTRPNAQAEGQTQRQAAQQRQPNPPASRTRPKNRN